MYVIPKADKEKSQSPDSSESSQINSTNDNSGTVKINVHGKWVSLVLGLAKLETAHYSISDHNLAFFGDNGESNDGGGLHGRDIGEHVAGRGELQSIDRTLL
ncbi:hypothetical protein CR513_24167, partial [Mucuna pruriens]